MKQHGQRPKAQLSRRFRVTASPLTYSLFALGLAAVLHACGVQEHPHEDPISVAAPTGPKVAPPALNTSITTASAMNPPPASAATSSPQPSATTSAVVPVASSGAPSMMASVGPVPSSGPMASASAMPTPSATSAMPMPSTNVPSGITVDINGTILPKENVVAFIHFGHSNMAGRASSPQESRPYFFEEQNLYAWVFRNGNWTVALEPDTAGDSGNMGFGGVLGGPGTALLKTAAEMAPNHYFVSLGFGKGSAYCSQFLPGGLYYDQVMASALQLKGKVTFAAIVIMLGITERHGTAEDISGYPDCINQLATQIRTDLEEPNLPLLLNDYEMESTGEELKPDGVFAQQIIPRIQMVPSVVANSALVPTDGLGMQDDHHFNLEGYREYVQRLLSIMKDKGWFPW